MSMLSAIFTVYIIATLLVAWYFRAKGKKKDQDFLINSKELGLLGISASAIASVIDNTNILLAVGVALIFGSGAFVIYIGISVAVALMSILAPRFWTLTREHGILTTSDFFRTRMGNKTNLLVAVITVILLFGWMAGGFIANATLLDTVFGWNKILATVVTAGIILLYTQMGGFKTIVKTDIFQLFVLALVLIMPFIVPISVSPGEILHDGHVFNTTTIVMIIVLACANISTPGIWQKLIAAKTRKVATYGLLLYAAGMLVVFLPLVWVSFNIIAAVPGVTVDNAFYLGLSQLLPGWFTPLAMVALYAALMSSIDTNLFSTAINTTKNVLLPYSKTVKNHLIGSTRIAMGIWIVLSAIFSLYFQSLVGYILGLIAIVGVFTFPFITALYKKIPDWLGVVAFASGLGIYIIILFVDYFSANYAWNILPAVVPGAVLMVGLLIVKVRRSYNNY